VWRRACMHCAVIARCWCALHPLSCELAHGRIALRNCLLQHGSVAIAISYDSLQALLNGLVLLPIASSLKSSELHSIRAVLLLLLSGSWSGRFDCVICHDLLYRVVTITPGICCVVTRVFRAVLTCAVVLQMYLRGCSEGPAAGCYPEGRGGRYCNTWSSQRLSFCSPNPP
jgi:hypothetical protein